MQKLDEVVPSGKRKPIATLSVCMKYFVVSSKSNLFTLNNFKYLQFEPFFFILKQSYEQIVLVQIVRVPGRKKHCQLKRQCRNYNQSLLRAFFFQSI